MPARSRLLIPALVLGLAGSASAAAPWQTRAAGYLEPRVAAWLASPPHVSNVPCAMSCHTTLPYLMARGGLGVETPEGDALRRAIETRVHAIADDRATPFYGTPGTAKWRESRGTEAVVNAVALVFDDQSHGRPLATITKTALAQMWAAQRSDGGWDWLEFSLEPWQARDDWGTAMAALVAGRAGFDGTRLQSARIKRLVDRVNARLADGDQPMALHDRATVLWASDSLPGLISPAAAAKIRGELVRTQHRDGGFSLDEWVHGTTGQPGDGYATALATLALCATGGRDSGVKHGIAWLVRHQTTDGSWRGRSANSSDARARLFMTDASTAYATLALATCSASSNARRRS